MEVEASVKELVQYIFQDNRNDSKIYMNLPFGETGIRDTHDLFTFFVDLLCKGLVLLFGDEQNKVALEKLNYHQISLVKHKLMNAGIELDITMSEVLPMDHNVLIRPCIFKGDGDNLDDYSLRLVSKNIEYTIKFKLLRI